MSNTVSLGTKKKSFKSIRLAAEAAGVPYMTFYMRIRAAEKAGGLGWKVATAYKRPVRVYTKQKKVETVYVTSTLDEAMKGSVETE